MYKHSKLSTAKCSHWNCKPESTTKLVQKSSAEIQLPVYNHETQIQYNISHCIYQQYHDTIKNCQVTQFALLLPSKPNGRCCSSVFQGTGYVASVHWDDCTTLLSEYVTPQRSEQWREDTDMDLLRSQLTVHKITCTASDGSFPLTRATQSAVRA